MKAFKIGACVLAGLVTGTAMVWLVMAGIVWLNEDRLVMVHQAGPGRLFWAVMSLCIGAANALSLWEWLFKKRQPAGHQSAAAIGDLAEGLSAVEKHAAEAGVQAEDLVNEVSRLIDENYITNPGMTCGEVVQQAKDNLRNKES